MLSLDWNLAGNPMNRTVCLHDLSFLSDHSLIHGKKSKYAANQINNSSQLSKGKKKKFNIMDALSKPVLETKNKERERNTKVKLSQTMCHSSGRKNPRIRDKS